jgi:hypothetical protein
MRMGKRKKKSCFLLLIETKYATAERCCSKDSFLFYSLFFVIIHRSSFFYRIPTKNRREILKYNAWVPKQNPPPPFLDSWPMQQRSKMIIIIIEKKANLTGGIVYVGFFFFFFFILYNLRGWITNPKLHFLTLILMVLCSDFILFQMNLKPSRNFSTLLLFSCFTSVPVIFLRTSDG